MISALKRHAEKSPCRHQHAAVVLAGSRVLAFGYNHDGLHAEKAALKRVKPSYRKHGGLVVISIRLKRDGTLGNSKPCQECQGYMERNGVVSVYYTDDKGKQQEMEVDSEWWPGLL